MLFCKASAPIRKTGPWQAAAYAILLLPWFGAACPALAGNMGDPSEPMRRRTAAAYPEYFGPTEPSAPRTGALSARSALQEPALARCDRLELQTAVEPSPSPLASTTVGSRHPLAGRGPLALIGDHAPRLLDPLFAPAGALAGVGPKNAKLFDRLLDRAAGRARHRPAVPFAARGARPPRAAENPRRPARRDRDASKCA